MTLHPFKCAAVVAAGYIAGLCFWSIAHAAAISPDQPAIPSTQMSSPPETPHELNPVPKTFRATITMYTSDPAETDDTPTITASGHETGPGVAACPLRFPFGTQIKVNGKIYTCFDRMAARYSGGDYFDLWVSTRDEAIHFGRQRLTVSVLE